MIRLELREIKVTKKDVAFLTGVLQRNLHGRLEYEVHLFPYSLS